MKQRICHVTNSSSSSFVISRKDITKEKLINILLEIANAEGKDRYDEWTEEDSYTLENDVRLNDEDKIYRWYRPKTVVAGRYCIDEVTEENTYDDYNGTEYKDVFVVDNESCVRYDWDIIEEILDKYGIPWSYGYCD